MLPAKWFTSLLLLTIGLTLYSPEASAQMLSSRGWPEWDSTNQVLFFISSSPGSVVRAYVDVQQRGADIDIYKDFPGAQSAYVDSVTAGPNGSTLIATTLDFGSHNIREVVVTYDSSGKLLKTWDPAPQYVEVIAYSKDDYAVFVLGGRNLPPGPYTSNYPILIEYSRDRRVLKTMVPGSLLKDFNGSFHRGSEVGQPLLRVTEDHLYLYASMNREVVMCDRDGVVLAYRNFTDAIEKISTDDDYHLVQVHQTDFAENGDLVLELLLWNDNKNNYLMDVVRLSTKTGEALSVHNALNSGRLSFVGMKDGQYLYLENLESGQNLYTQSAAGQEPQPLATQPVM
jgi:hypothetical protein